jgi:heparin binding hemagglutinin HbhA
MAKIPTFEIPTFEIPSFEIPTEAARPLYAAAGATDVLVGYVRDAVADVQKQLAGVQTRIGSLDFEPAALREVIEARVAELQGFVAENATTVNAAYADLAKRGETLVGRIRTQESTKATATAAKTTTAKAKTTKTQATKAAKKTTTTAKKSTKSTAKKATSTAKKTSAAPKSSAKATVTAAEKTAAAAVEATTDAAAKIGD